MAGPGWHDAEAEQPVAAHGAGLPGLPRDARRRSMNRVICEARWKTPCSAGGYGREQGRLLENPEGRVQVQTRNSEEDEWGVIIQSTSLIQAWAALADHAEAHNCGMVALADAARVVFEHRKGKSA